MSKENIHWEVKHIFDKTLNGKCNCSLWMGTSSCDYTFTDLINGELP